VEIIVGSYDVPGARLLDLVAVMDRLRSPGGCPWDAAQTHQSLVPYVIEESHELVEAIESGDRSHVQEELGDLLLQVVFHAQIAQEDSESPFGIDEVAGGIVEKLVRRHPHVFDDDAAATPAQLEELADSWEEIKAAEKPHRTLPLDGIPANLPALARADKAAGRLLTADRFDLAEAAAAHDDLGSRLFALVLEAHDQGQDPEAALRAVVRALEGPL
jgi:XTP/dITP diphosphohydrolase